MTLIKNLATKFPVSIYFVAVFLISWGGVILVAGSTGMPASPEDTARLFPMALTAMLAGPTLAGLLMTMLTFGSVGFRNLWSKMTASNVGLQWYGIAILLVPILTGSILWLLSQTWPSDYLPSIVGSNDKTSLVISGVSIGLAAGFFEEIGWTGFAIPLLRQKHNTIVTGLITGVLWGIWHFLVTFWASGDSSGVMSRDLLFPPLVFYVGVLPAYRVLMVLVYDRTESLLLSMLMHASLTTCTITLLVPPTTGMPLIKYYVILTAAFWIVIANMLPAHVSIIRKDQQNVKS